MRRHWLTLGLLVGALALSPQLAADEPRVPPRLSAELLAKVIAYDRHLAARARGRVLVLIIVAPKVAESARFGAQIRAELSKQTRLGGLEHMQEIVNFTSAEELAHVCRARQPAVVYLAPGLSEVMAAIAEALAGLDVLSVSALAEDVQRGAVLGFDVVSGKPKLVVNLPRARLQHVAFKPELLRLARVIQ